MKGSWKTTAGGLLAAAGIALRHSEMPSLKAWSDVVEGLGVTLIGMAARDNGVSSEQAGIKPQTAAQLALASTPDNTPTKPL